MNFEPYKNKKNKKNEKRIKIEIIKDNKRKPLREKLYFHENITIYDFK